VKVTRRTRPEQPYEIQILRLLAKLIGQHEMYDFYRRGFWFLVAVVIGLAFKQAM
jgi:hypothetical protein